MSKGVVFAISNILSSLILGILFAVGLEYLVVNFIFNGILTNFNVGEFDFSVVYIMIFAIFISQIFSKRSLTNFLFVIGYSRKNINTIKIISTIFTVFIVFAITISSFFAFNDINFSIFSNLDFLIYITFLFFIIFLFSEIGIYINILYRRKSVKKAKGENKKIYKFVYTFIFAIFIYIFRFFYIYKIKNTQLISAFNLTLIGLGVSILFSIIFCFLNRRNILTLDIK